MDFIVGVAIGAVIASASWWVYVRSLHGVIADLQNVKTDAAKVAAKL